MAGRLFRRRRDGQIEVRLNDAGRAMVREIFAHVVAAERDPEHEWRAVLNAPIDPSRDEDDPVLNLQRQHDVSTNAELAVVSLNETLLTDAEAWAWLTTIQIALRSTALTNGLMSEEKLESCPAELLEEIRTMQQFLFELAACF